MINRKYERKLKSGALECIFYHDGIAQELNPKVNDNGKLVLELGKPALSVTYSPDGKYLVTGSEANTRIWNLNIGDLILE